MIFSAVFFGSRLEQLAMLAARHRVPATYQFREFASAGGPDELRNKRDRTHRQAGVYAGRILKGDKPADLPVMQPTKFDFIINLTTAKALGLEISPSLLARADEVIE
jgi:putative tryptophan/tyrosine transport system substrate-binding protein